MQFESGLQSEAIKQRFFGIVISPNDFLKTENNISMINDLVLDFIAWNILMIDIVTANLISWMD